MTTTTIRKRRSSRLAGNPAQDNDHSSGSSSATEEISAEEAIDDALDLDTPSTASGSETPDRERELDQNQVQGENRLHTPKITKKRLISSSILSQILHFPQRFFAALAGIFGLAQFSRLVPRGKVGRVVPRQPGLLTLRRQVPTQWIDPGRGIQRAPGAQQGEAGQEQSEEAQNGEEVRFDTWVERNVKCLEGSFRPSWWLPKWVFPVALFASIFQAACEARRSYLLEE